MTFAKPGQKYLVDWSDETDDHSDPAFRHCRIKKIDGARLIRTFTGKVQRFQSTRRQVKHRIVRWCELNPARLPGNGGAVILDLDHVWEAQSDLGG
jgi:hypothetical protein